MKIPKHLVIYPDGNFSWASKNGLPPWDGYKKGYENLINFAYWCKNRGVKVLTVFGFSSETWDRTKIVIDFMLKLFEDKLRENLEKLAKNNELEKLGVRIKIIGQRDRLPKSLQEAIAALEESTKKNKKLFLNLAVSYGGKWDILNAVKSIIKTGVAAEKVDEKLFESYLSMAGLPDPDFIIRAGGKMRLSNFALWNLGYTELYFVPKFWPDFTEKDLDAALAEFSNRQRRFVK